MSSRWLAIVVILVSAALPGVVAAQAAEDMKPSLPTMMQRIIEQVALGSRAVGSTGHAGEIWLIERELRASGLQPWRQEWKEPIGKRTVAFTNVIASYRPQARKRVILGTHYDTIVRAYRDKAQPDAIMPGANNGASGVAVLLELARRVSTFAKPDTGVDFIFFDGEEGPLSLGGGDENWRAIGSPHFIDSIPGLYAHKKIESVIIFDMVCYRHALIRPEMSSVDQSAAQVEKFWEIASEDHPALFSFDPLSYRIEDDHTAFMKVGLPAFLVIGFEYEPWYNTTRDTPDKCSADTLAAVADAAMRYVGGIDRQH